MTADCCVYANITLKYCCIAVASHKYGYGLMDATAMVELAEKWVTVPPQRVCHTDIVVLNA